MKPTDEVARAIIKAQVTTFDANDATPEARAAIAVVLKEAIKVARGDPSRWPVHSEWANGYQDGRSAAITALRALATHIEGEK